jgi:predicted O-linked N-acetylglucosamine transferase (SPINDLY family)
MLGNVASELDDLDAAVLNYERARDLRPDDHVIRHNLGLNQLWRGYIEAAIDELRAACELNPVYLPAQSSYLVALHSSDRASPEQIAAATRNWAARFAVQHPEAKMVQRRLSRRPLIGFISGDFRAHSVAHFFEPIASARDREAFDYTFYCNSPQKDAITERLRGYADKWRDVWQLTDEALCDLNPRRRNRCSGRSFRAYRPQPARCFREPSRSGTG